MRRHRFKGLTRRILLTAAALSIFSGCGHPVQRTLEGRWMGESVENFDDENIPAATGWARGASMEFAGHEITVTIPAEDPRTAPYKIVGVHQNKLKLSVDGSGAQETLALILDDEQSMRWMLDDSRTIVMRRQ
jgi:hypothetical protein